MVIGMVTAIAFSVTVVNVVCANAPLDMVTVLVQVTDWD